MTEHTQEDTRTQVYELSYHISATLSDADREETLTAVRSAVEKAGGNFLAEGALEDTDLAYAITAHGDAHTKSAFGWLKFELDPAAAEALMREVLPAEKRIIRFSLIKTVAEDTRASAQARTQGGSGVVQEVETKGTLEKKPAASEEGGEVSEEALDEALDDLTEDDK